MRTDKAFGLPLLAVLALAPAATRAADEAKPPDARALDRQLYDTLRDVHNKGADLYNAGDPVSCYRMFQGALMVARPALAHRPDVQKAIDEGLAEADKQPLIGKRAFALHELIERVRADIRPGGKGEPRPPEKPPEGGKAELLPNPRVVNPEVKKPPEKEPEPKKQPETKNEPGARGSVTGKLTLKGQPLGGVDVTFVMRDSPELRVFETTTKEDGSYTLAGVKPGKYTVLVTPGKKAKATINPVYALTTSSPLLVEVKDNGGAIDLNLQ